MATHGGKGLAACMVSATRMSADKMKVCHKHTALELDLNQVLRWGVPCASVRAILQLAYISKTWTAAEIWKGTPPGNLYSYHFNGAMLYGLVCTAPHGACSGDKPHVT